MYSRDQYPKYRGSGVPIPEGYSGCAVRRAPSGGIAGSLPGSVGTSGPSGTGSGAMLGRTVRPTAGGAMSGLAHEVRSEPRAYVSRGTTGRALPAQDATIEGGGGRMSPTRSLPVENASERTSSTHEISTVGSGHHLPPSDEVDGGTTAYPMADAEPGTEELASADDERESDVSPMAPTSSSSLLSGGLSGLLSSLFPHSAGEGGASRSEDALLIGLLLLLSHSEESEELRLLLAALLLVR